LTYRRYLLAEKCGISAQPPSHCWRNAAACDFTTRYFSGFLPVDPSSMVDTVASLALSTGRREDARQRARMRRRTTISPARCSACRRGRRRGGLQVHNPASWRCLPRRMSAWAKAWWPVALGLYQLRGPGALLSKRFRGCRAKRLYVRKATRGLAFSRWKTCHLERL